MSVQSVNRFTQFLLHNSSVQLIAAYLTDAHRMKMATVCRSWRDHAILLAERKKSASRLVQSVTAQGRHPIVVFLGRPGAGKGTLAQALVQAAAFRHFSLGDHFRRLIAVGDPLVRGIQEDILNHKPIPIALIYDAVEKQLQALGQYGIILDGFPKDPKSIAFFDQLVKAKYPNHPIIAVYIKVDRKIAEERLATRGTCEKCDLIFNLTIQDVCSRCNVKLQPRPDAIAKGRQDGFEEKFAASFAYFKNRLVEIDGSKPTAECLKALKEIVN